jgi:rubrerythrin
LITENIGESGKKMNVKERLAYFKSQIKIENEIINTAETSAKNIENIIVREMVLGIAMDSRKHKSLLSTLIALHERIALIDEPITDQLKQNLEEHIRLEQKAIDTYKKLLDNLEDEREKLIIRFILKDEIRHHKFLKQLHEDLVEKLTFTDEDYWNWAWKDTEWGGGS